MKKYVLSAAVISALFLSACGNKETKPLNEKSTLSRLCTHYLPMYAGVPKPDSLVYNEDAYNEATKANEELKLICKAGVDTLDNRRKAIAASKVIGNAIAFYNTFKF